MSSLARIAGTFENIIRESVLETITARALENEIEVDRTTLGRLIAKNREAMNSGIFLEDAKKGSWELCFGALLLTLIGKTAYDLGIHYVKQNPRFVDFMKWLNEKTSKPTSTAIEQKVQRLDTIGPFLISERRTEIIVDQFGHTTVKIELVLARMSDNIIPATYQEQSEVIRKLFGYKDDSESQ